MSLLTPRPMKADRLVLGLAGTLILAGTILTATGTTAGLWLTGAVGVMLIVAGISGFCAGAWLLEKCGYKPACRM